VPALRCGLKKIELEFSTADLTPHCQPAFVWNARRHTVALGVIFVPCPVLSHIAHRKGDQDSDAATVEQTKIPNQVSALSYSLAIITQINCTRSVNSAPWQVGGGVDTGTNRSDRRAGRVATPVRLEKFAHRFFCVLTA
jgi:hypothetical protein